jgi:peptide/nickel transport system substrate-binding protein
MCDRSAPFPSSALSTTDFGRHGFKQNRREFIEPELAESWSWDEDHTRLTFNLRGGVNWQDGKPFTAADVKCSGGTSEHRRRCRKAIAQ